MIQVSLTYRLDDVLHTIRESDEHVRIETVVDDSRVTVNLHTSALITLEDVKILRHHLYHKDDLIFVNGYQSWTDTKQFYASENLRDLSKLPGFVVNQYAFDGYGDTTFKKYQKGVLHSWECSEVGDIFIGSLNYKNAYLIINHDTNNQLMILESDCKGYTFQGDFTVFDYVEDKEAYLSSFACKPCPKLLGYTSWYNYYEDINEKKILDNLDGIEAPFELFQIDDGYENHVGDWMSVDVSKFPNGLEPIVEKIHNKGLKAGIWLAPLIAEEESTVYRTHPDWFLKTKAGSNWSGFYGLDVTNPDAMNYVQTCLQHYVDLGFDFFKLDFLYAINLNDTKLYTKAQLSEIAYKLIAEVLQDRMVLGCGAMISNAAGKFNYMRIGPDVSLKFDDVWYMQHMHRERISTKVTLQNTIYRSFMDQRLFGNDPDVFLLRDDNISLSKEQRRALIAINALFGTVLMTSDMISQYDDEKKELLESALELRQATNKTYTRHGDSILITYELNGTHEFKYDTKKGILYEEK